jgi:hypothetical protein
MLGLVALILAARPIHGVTAKRLAHAMAAGLGLHGVQYEALVQVFVPSAKMSERTSVRKGRRG